MEPAQDDDVEAAAVAVEETELVPVLAARPTAVAEKDDLGFNSDISMRTYIMDTLRGRPFASTERRRNPREAARRVGKGGRRLVAEQTPAPDARGTPQVPHGQHARDVHGRGHVPRVRAAARNPGGRRRAVPVLKRTAPASRRCENQPERIS